MVSRFNILPIISFRNKTTIHKLKKSKQKHELPQFCNLGTTYPTSIYKFGEAQPSIKIERKPVNCRSHSMYAMLDGINSYLTKRNNSYAKYLYKGTSQMRKGITHKHFLIQVELSVASNFLLPKPPELVSFSARSKQILNSDYCRHSSQIQQQWFIMN